MTSSTDKSFRIGICGLGTVGGGTLDLLTRNRDEIASRVGAPIEVVHVATRTLDPDRVSQVARSGTDPFAVADDPEVDVLVETIGGFEPALDLVRRALTNGKHVVTANKALIAEHGNELFALARDKRATLAYESAVGGGIPIIKALREGLAANRIDWLAGIINGTGNFILTEMAARQRQFEDVLKQAQDLGYAEADPTFDVEGIDAAHKLSIMASIAFGIPLRFEQTYTEGINRITPEDIAYAAELGYVIKHLGIARKTPAGVELRVHPTLVTRSRLLANVNGVYNAVMVHGDAVGSTMYSGPGAGASATASAVVADIIDLARYHAAGADGPVHPGLGYHHPNEEIPIVPIEEIEAEYYLRIPVVDKVGVMARLSNILQSHDINIEAVIQKELDSESVPIVILTDLAREKQLNKAIAALEAMGDVTGSIARIRLEPFHGNKD
ncbi:MAG: homoserine dehydrogenase [Pseudohongiellaceae bacterium]